MPFFCKSEIFMGLEFCIEGEKLQKSPSQDTQKLSKIEYTFYEISSKHDANSVQVSSSPAKLKRVRFLMRKPTKLGFEEKERIYEP